MDRLLSKVPSSGTGISFLYTPTGQRQQMTYGAEVTNYTQYDNRDRLLTKQTPEGTLTYTYDAHGNVLTINSSNTNGASMTYTYDALNRLATAKDNRVAAQRVFESNHLQLRRDWKPVGVCVHEHGEDEQRVRSAESADADLPGHKFPCVFGRDKAFQLFVRAGSGWKPNKRH